MSKHPHILNAASNLLGIALIIITGLSVAMQSQRSLADEVAWLAAIFLSLRPNAAETRIGEAGAKGAHSHG